MSRQSRLPAIACLCLNFLIDILQRLVGQLARALADREFLRLPAWQRQAIGASSPVDWQLCRFVLTRAEQARDTVADDHERNVDQRQHQREQHFQQLDGTHFRLELQSCSTRTSSGILLLAVGSRACILLQQKQQNPGETGKTSPLSNRTETIAEVRLGGICAMGTQHLTKKLWM